MQKVHLVNNLILKPKYLFFLSTFAVTSSTAWVTIGTVCPAPAVAVTPTVGAVSSLAWPQLTVKDSPVLNVVVFHCTVIHTLLALVIISVILSFLWLLLTEDDILLRPRIFHFFQPLFHHVIYFLHWQHVTGGLACLLDNSIIVFECILYLFKSYTYFV